MKKEEKDIFSDLRPYCVSLRILNNLMMDYSKSSYFLEKNYENIVKNFDELVEKGVIVKGSDKHYKGECFKKDYNVLLVEEGDDYSGIEDKKLKDLKIWKIYIKGIPLNKIKTRGGYLYNEIAAKAVSIYDPLRNRI